MTDLSTWYPKPEAARRMGISERTLDRRCESGSGPERRERPRPGLKPEPVYNPDDVERLATPKAHVMPADVAIPVDERSPVPVARPSSPDLLPALLDRVGSAVESWLAETRPPVPPALYLTLPQASAYTGLTVALLRRLVKAGKLAAIRDRAVKVRRADLENLVIDGMATTGLARLSKCPCLEGTFERDSKPDRALPPTLTGV